MPSIILYHNFGLGDCLMCHGIVREYCKKYEKVAIFVLPHNYRSVAFMYKDLKNLNIIKGDAEFAGKFISENDYKIGKDKYNYIKNIGSDRLNINSGKPLQRQFYELADIEFSKTWDSFFVERDLEKEISLFNKIVPEDNYVFLHEDTDRNYIIERGKINDKYKIVSADDQHTDNIFDYCTIIEKAKEIHVIDSSFMFLIDLLNYNNPEQKLYVHRYARENSTWKLPILRKNWEIITLINSSSKRKGVISKILDKIENFFLNSKLTKRITRKIYRVMNWRTRWQKGGSI